MKMSVLRGLLGLLLLAGPASGAVQLLDFEGLPHGQVVTSQIPGVTVSAVNRGGGPDLAVAFDSRRTGTADSDLEDPWSIGNLAPNTVLGNVLIVQENSRGIGDGIADSPDDEAGGGRLILNFAAPFTSIGFDLIDIEGQQEPGNVKIRRGSAELLVIPFLSFAGQNGVVFGNDSANRIAPISGFGLADNVVFVLKGSGAIDNVRVESVPEPAAIVVWLALATACGLGCAARGRRLTGARLDPS